MHYLELTEYAVGTPPTLVRTGQKSLNLFWPDLLWGAITVGRRNHFELFRFGFSSRMEMVWRAAILLSNLRTMRNGRNKHFVKSDAFECLDGSEKGAATYFLGLALAKVAAEVEYGVTWLMHLDVYSKSNRVTGVHVPVLALPGRIRPDLIGQHPSGDWLVMESKGRTGKVDRDLRLKAKDQTRRILTVNHKAPRWRVGSIISLDDSVLRLELIDPSDASPDAVAINVPDDVFVANYYRPILAMLADAAGTEVKGPDGALYRSAYIADADFGVGLWAPLYEMLSLALTSPDGSLTAAGAIQGLRDRVVRALANREKPISSDTVRVGTDGVMVQIGRRWQDWAERKIG